MKDASREMPNKLDILQVKGDNSKKVLVPKHDMEVTQQEAFDMFKSNNLNVKIALKSTEDQPQQQNGLLLYLL